MFSRLFSSRAEGPAEAAAEEASSAVEQAAEAVQEAAAAVEKAVEGVAEEVVDKAKEAVEAVKEAVSSREVRAVISVARPQNALFRLPSRATMGASCEERGRGLAGHEGARLGAAAGTATPAGPCISVAQALAAKDVGRDLADRQQLLARIASGVPVR